MTGVTFGRDELASGHALLQRQVEVGVGLFVVFHLEVGQDVLLDGDLGGALLVSQSHDGFGDHVGEGRMRRRLASGLGFGSLLGRGGGGSRGGSGFFRHFELLVWLSVRREGEQDKQ